jgi:hypothetical protein
MVKLSHELQSVNPLIFCRLVIPSLQLDRASSLRRVHPTAPGQLPFHGRLLGGG